MPTDIRVSGSRVECFELAMKFAAIQIAADEKSFSP